jgi:hypothetical protein
MIKLAIGMTFLVTPLFAQRHSTITIRPLDKADTLAKFLDVIDIRSPKPEREKHKIIWQRDDVRTLAIQYATDGGVVFTMTDDGTNMKRDKYVIGLYLLQEEREKKLGTFRINKSGRVSGQLTVEKSR